MNRLLALLLVVGAGLVDASAVAGGVAQGTGLPAPAPSSQSAQKVTYFERGDNHPNYLNQSPRTLLVATLKEDRIEASLLPSLGGPGQGDVIIFPDATDGAGAAAKPHVSSESRVWKAVNPPFHGDNDWVVRPDFSVGPLHGAHKILPQKERMLSSVRKTGIDEDDKAAQQQHPPSVAIVTPGEKTLQTYQLEVGCKPVMLNGEVLLDKPRDCQYSWPDHKKNLVRHPMDGIAIRQPRKPIAVTGTGSGTGTGVGTGSGQHVPNTLPEDPEIVATNNAAMHGRTRNTHTAGVQQQHEHDGDRHGGRNLFQRWGKKLRDFADDILQPPSDEQDRADLQKRNREKFDEADRQRRQQRQARDGQMNDDDLMHDMGDDTNPNHQQPRQRTQQHHNEDVNDDDPNAANTNVAGGLKQGDGSSDAKKDSKSSGYQWITGAHQNNNGPHAYAGVHRGEDEQSPEKLWSHTRNTNGRPAPPQGGHRLT